MPGLAVMLFAVFQLALAVEAFNWEARIKPTKPIVLQPLVPRAALHPKPIRSSSLLTHNRPSPWCFPTSVVRLGRPINCQEQTACSAPTASTSNAGGISMARDRLNLHILKRVLAT